MATFTLTEAREIVRNATGTDEIDLPDPKLDTQLNLSYRALLDQYAFREKEVTANFQTEAGKRNYEMPDPHDALRGLEIITTTTFEHRTVDPMTVDEYKRVWKETIDARGFPSHYIRESCLFRLWPTPDGVYDMIIRYWGILADLSSINQTIDIPQVWWSPILDGGIVNVCKYYLGDLERAAAYTRFQAKAISDITPTEVKEEEDRHRAGVQVIGINREL